MSKYIVVDISLKQIGKKYQQEWIFRKVSLELQTGDTLAILGKNGSGKTTLIKLISGAVMPNEGEIFHTMAGARVPTDKLYQYLSFAAPYHELIEELTVQEMVDFYARFKSFRDQLTLPDLLSVIHLLQDADKKIKACSSGMKQKLRLALAIYSNTPLLLLDEPLTNLDQEGIQWFLSEMEKPQTERLVVVCSNHFKEEYGFCKRQLLMEDLKISAPDGNF